ncbi:MAG: anaerobic ribonucleoside-triphosphate reductase activating protein [Syntrophobacterales bacterium]|nr:MAG: anaerobic ribonucleoside-triphosphate reductase activating protein [Syntrophobacterales bacterium]
MEIQIKGFLETSLLDWPGKLTAVLFLPGCNFRCPYCHNHSLVIHPERFETIPLEYILMRLKGLKGWIDGVCVTGGEPTLTPQLPLLLEEIKNEGWAIKLDTNGTFPDRIKELIERNLVDCVAMDIKAPLDSIAYSRCAGVSVDIPVIRKSISVLGNGGVDYSFRMTVVPSLLTEEQVYEAALQLVGMRGLLLQDFNPSDPLGPGLRGIEPFGEMRLQRMQERVDAIVGQRGDSYSQPTTRGRGYPLQRMNSSIGRRL